MKKTAFALFFMLLALSAFAAAETTDELNIMNTPPGAQIRFLQLSRSLSDRIIIGEAVIEAILENSPDANVSGAEDVLGEMRLLLEEIEEIDYDSQNATELAKLFVISKKEAISLVKEFRELTKESLLSGEKERIRQMINQSIMEKNRGINDKIRNMINSHNAFLINKLEKAVNWRWENLSEKVRNGSIGPDLAKEAMKQAIRSMGSEARGYARSIFEEEKAKASVFAMNSYDKAMSGMAKLFEERADARKKMLNNSGLSHLGGKSKGNIGESSGSDNSNGNSGGNSGSGSSSGNGNSGGSGGGTGSSGGKGGGN